MRWNNKKKRYEDH